MGCLPRFALWLFVFFCSSMIVLAQSPQTPECAQPCLVGAFATNICSPADIQCICTHPVFQNNFTQCVVTSCTVPDALMARNASLTTCKAPVRNRGPHYQRISDAMFSIASIFTLIRFAYKLTLARTDLGADDWCTLATTLFCISSAVVTSQGTVKFGLGQDLWTLHPHEITSMLKSFYVMSVLYFAQAALLKLCLLAFYIRVFPAKVAVYRLIWATIIFVSLWGTIFVFIAIFQCRPVSYFFTNWDGLHEGRCINISAFPIAHAVISIVLDFWILGVPLWQIPKLQMHWKKKVGVGFMFCVGTFVTIVSCIRLKAVIVFGRSYNPSWDFYDVAFWSTMEISVGIMCACLPPLRQFLAMIFPIIKSQYSSSLGRTHRSHLGSEGSIVDSKGTNRDGTAQELHYLSRDRATRKSQSIGSDGLDDRSSESINQQATSQELRTSRDGIVQEPKRIITQHTIHAIK